MVKLKPLERYGPGMCHRSGRQCVVDVADGTVRRGRCSLRWYATCSGANEYGRGRAFAWELAWENYPLSLPNLPKHGLAHEGATALVPRFPRYSVTEPIEGQTSGGRGRWDFQPPSHRNRGIGQGTPQYSAELMGDPG